MSGEPAMALATNDGTSGRDAIPLCVLLEYALVASNMPFEWWLRSLRGHGRSDQLSLTVNQPVAATDTADASHLQETSASAIPFSGELLHWLRAEHAGGRQLVLVTSGSQELASQIATLLGIFHSTISGAAATPASLESRFGRGGFDLAASHRNHPHLWRLARNVIVVGSPLQLQRISTMNPRIEKHFPATVPSPLAWLRALRAHQWAKNLLIFVPAVVSHRIFEANVFTDSVLAFFCFGLCASATYLFNDLLDLDADRGHVRKRDRPFASGVIDASYGAAVAPLLLAAGLILAFAAVGPVFAVLMLLYVAGTLWYTWSLKRIAMVDVLTLASLYTLRVLAGSAATTIEPSFWLLAFSMFMFLSLALVKRYTELRALAREGRLAVSGRGYTTDDLSLLLSCGTSSGYISVLVLALYVSQGTERLYGHPMILWLLCPLMLYWISRVWRKAHRGELDDDPVLFALRDKPSIGVAALCGLLVALAS
jgi:4-hydroxybenzoate polyprenyltransferase